MKTEKSWQKERAALREVKTLAAMANLERADVENFLHKHPHFVPPVWWTSPAWSEGLGTYVPWMRERDLLRDAWVAEFPADITIKMATANLFHAAHALASDTTEEMENTPEKVWPYQRAVLFLHVNPWRAKTCEWCERRFIGEHPKARFCRFGVVVDGKAITCFWAHRKKYKNENWNEHSSNINKQRRREYRVKKKRSRRANWKNLRQR
jgi:hypothetical protein